MRCVIQRKENINHTGIPSPVYENTRCRPAYAMKKRKEKQPLMRKLVEYPEKETPETSITRRTDPNNSCKRSGIGNFKKGLSVISK